MAYALVLHIAEATPNASIRGIDITYNVFFGGDGIIDGGDLTLVPVSVLPGDSAVQIRDKVGTAVREEATRLGVNVPAGSVIQPNYAKG